MAVAQVFTILFTSERCDPDPMNDVPASRLISLDAFRGLSIAAMILVNNPGSWDHVYPQLLHAEWVGWTFTDLIFPTFLFIGAPGCGKGTQSELLCRDYDLAHISIGEIFRWHVRNHTKLAARIRRITEQGLLVPDEIVEEVVRKRLEEHDWNYGFVLDGFPRHSSSLWVSGPQGCGTRGEADADGVAAAPDAHRVAPGGSSRATSICCLPRPRSTRANHPS